jgi:hypothetical protein
MFQIKTQIESLRKQQIVDDTTHTVRSSERSKQIDMLETIVSELEKEDKKSKESLNIDGVTTSR